MLFYPAYNLLSIFLLIPVVIHHLYRSISRGRKPALIQRFGLIPSRALEEIDGRPVIWVHAVSVGEAIAARPLLRGLKRRYPGNAILVSSSTETGKKIVSGFPEKDASIYFPFDFLPSVSIMLGRVRPVMVIVMETEIWPNFCRAVALRNIPLILANGRISDRSFPRYQTFRRFFRRPLGLFSKLCMQTESDRERITTIGAPFERTVVCGNLKYDIPWKRIGKSEKSSLRKRYALPDDLTVIIAASTHEGEEQEILSAYSKILAAKNRIFLIMAPRHPERVAEVSAIIRKQSIRCRLRSEISGSPYPFSAGEALLIDSMGEMMDLYSISDIAFVGGSLAPVGGHNLLEPASCGIPFIFGPQMANFREISEFVIHYGAGVQINSAEEFTKVLQEMIQSEELRLVIGNNGLKLMRDKGGAVERHIEMISGFLPESDGSGSASPENSPVILK